MDIIKLSKRLKKASESNSLRELATKCDTSHESIRKILHNNPDITLTVFNKVDKGLKQNGF
jgi:hypothetical protein